MTEFPYPRDFNNMMHSTIVSDFTVMVDYVITSNKIYSPNIHSLKGKTVRRQKTPVVTEYISILPEFIKYHGDTKVEIDVIYTRKIAFAISASLGIRFSMAEYVNDK